MPLERGAVYFTRLELTRRGGGTRETLDKYVVILQAPDSMDAGATNAALVVASTDRSHGRGPRSFEVALGADDGFDGPTMVDGRWVYTIPRTDLPEEQYRFTLTEDVMSAISLAIFIGLQLDT